MIFCAVAKLLSCIRFEGEAELRFVMVNSREKKNATDTEKKKNKTKTETVRQTELNRNERLVL